MSSPRTPATVLRPRVMQFITRLGLGGAEGVAFSIMRALQGEIDFAVFAVRGVERSDIGNAMERELSTLRIPLYQGVKVPLKLGGMLFAGLRAKAAMRQFQPAVAHLHTEIPESAYATMTALSSGTAPKLVRTIHNSVYWHFWPRLGRWCEQRMRESHVAAVSHDALAAFIAHRERSEGGPLPLPPRVIYNGVSIPAAVAARPTQGRLRVLFAGRFEPEKGTDLIPEIIRQVAPPSGGAELVLHGQGGHRGALEAFAAAPPPGWTISVHPPTADLKTRMSEFDLVIMPSRFEGLGLVAVEALLLGVPPILTRAPGLRETVPADYPWAAPVGAAPEFARILQRALQENPRASAEFAAAQVFARTRFAPEQMAAGYRQLYADAASL